MYFFKTYSLLGTDKYTLHLSEVLCSYMLLKASILVQVIDLRIINILYIKNYEFIAIYLLRPIVLIFSIYHLIHCQLLLFIMLEVNTFNICALSLYVWLGFSILSIRKNYYYQFKCINSGSAYNLINSKNMSKNMLRRYLMLENSSVYT